MWNEAQARRAYNAYGVDLIRTAGLLLRTTPSAVFRASILFQRLQRCINANFRSRYLSSEETKWLIEEARGSSPVEGGSLQGSLAEYSSKNQIGCASSDKVEYLIPNHVGHEMVSGLMPLADLFAPLDYCVSHIIDHEDVGFLAAACLLVAVKMEDPGIRIRHVVNVFMRLSQRRCGISSMIYLKPPPERYEDFKACVVEAEEVLLQQIGFQTFVECPHKYAVIFLNILVEDKASTKAENGAASPAFTSWLSRAISWINDAPRCEMLAQFQAIELAAFAIKWSCPGGITLPERWNVALGVPDDVLERIQAAYEGYLGGVEVSSKEELHAIRATMPKVEYRTIMEKIFAAQRESDLAQGARQGNEDRKAEASAGHLAASEYDEMDSKLGKKTSAPATASFAAPSNLPVHHHPPAVERSNGADLLGAIGLPYPEPPAIAHDPGVPLRVSPRPPENEESASSSFSASDDEDDFEYEDLRQVQKQRRKEAAEELHRRNVVRSEERHRKKHRSPDRHQERSQGRRHHHQSRRADRYGDDRKGRDRERRDRDRDSGRGGDKVGRGGRRYDLKRDHVKRDDERRRRH
ncbi:unnamed protein product [Phytomonas sp. EM1]|nr:unnamed protein product [Phytomonas sp. EM1]|eukprot:CCW63314.1 unnamed protein product [Phytomonas sp. isolate EM1]